MTATLEQGIALYNEQKYKEAYDALYDLAAYERNAEAQYYLGMMYRHGEGVEKDIDKAMQWWRKAMREGHQGAAYSLSEISTSTKTTF